MIFSNKNILITGASSGIGKALIRFFANDNCTLILLARRIEILNKIKNEFVDSSCKIFPFKCDVTNKIEVVETLNKIKSEVGKIDIAILNAGISERLSLLNSNSLIAEQIINTNFLSIVHFIENLLQDFIERKNGAIVGVSSLADVRGFPKSGIYCASKSALSTYLESLRVELKSFNIKVITVRPGFIKTPMTDKNEFKMPFLMNVNKAAKIIHNGIKKEKKIIQFPFVMVLLTNILKIFPNFLFDRLIKINLKQK